ncbi:MAG: hypothetical protein RMI94_12235 [Bryobacterales bacterium]|nr:hypothetical protein [Bryobacteraceae bacterium]MDW8131314.1 hypothetical protein [Bryobacterales bacterium]
MSRYEQKPLDFCGLKTVPLGRRGGKVRVEQFARAYQRGAGLAAWLERLPRILAAEDFRALAGALAAARRQGKPVIWGLGGHVIKCGLAPVLVDLMDRGYASAFAMNGAAAIHDFEIGLAGATSEDVEAALPDGSFGAAEETGREINEAAREAAREGIGLGEALGRRLEALADAQFGLSSLLLQAYLRRVPVTVHVALGTDTTHTHPAADGAALGAASHHDFRLFCRLVAGLDHGGVYVNVGSAVILPEVFLKAVSAVRNLGHRLEQFTTANLDFLSHYRPRVNVLERPHARAGGRGISLLGHHELMLPLLAAALIEMEP